MAIYSNIDLARVCEIAVILSQYDTGHTDSHDFFSDHVKPIYIAWLYSSQDEVYKFKNKSERNYITEYTNRIAKDLYTIKSRCEKFSD